MEPIFPITALSKDQAAVKEAARDSIVRITEHGAAAWIFTSEEALEQRIQKAVDDAVYEAQIAWMIERGRRDFAEGRYITGTENAKKKAAEMRAAQ